MSPDNATLLGVRGGVWGDAVARGRPWECALAIEALSKYEERWE